MKFKTQHRSFLVGIQKYTAHRDGNVTWVTTFQGGQAMNVRTEQTVSAAKAFINYPSVN